MRNPNNFEKKVKKSEKNALTLFLRTPLLYI